MADAPEPLKTWTARKLDWLQSVALDPTINPRAFLVAFCLAQHVNAETGLGIVSDELIGHETTSSRQEVIRARLRLREVGWIEWTRTGSASIYRPLFDRCEEMAKRRAMLREGRAVARAARRSIVRIRHRMDDVPPARHLRDVPPARQRNAP
jgi:hypothetical protein